MVPGPGCKEVTGMVRFFLFFFGFVIFQDAKFPFFPFH